MTAKADAGASADFDFLQFMADCVVVLHHRIVHGIALRFLRIAKLGFLLTVLRQPQRGWYNLRSNIQLSIGELAQQLLELTGVRREIVFSPEYQHYEPRPIEAFDMTEALELGWRPLVSSLRDGLRSDGARLALGGE